MPSFPAFRSLGARVYRVFCIIEDFVLVLILAVLTVSVFVIVFFRFVLNDPVIWADIFPRLLMIWLTFLGAARAIRINGHIVVDYFARLTPGNGKYLGYVVDVALLFFLTFLMWIGIRYTAYAWSQNAAPLDLPYSFFTAALPTFAIIALFHKLYALSFAYDNQNETEHATNIGAS